MLKRFILGLVRLARLYYLRLLREPESAHRMALGLAIGVFWGLTPTIPVQTVLALGLAFFLRANKLGAVVGVWVTNPFTVPFLYPAFYYTGHFLLPFLANGGPPRAMDLSSLIQASRGVVIATMAGGLLWGLVFAPLTYYLAHKRLRRFQLWRAGKLREKGILPPSTKPEKPAAGEQE